MKTSILLTLLVVLLASGANAQIGQFYTHQDTLHLSSTPVDTLFSVKYQEALIWSYDAAMLFRIGAPDTNSWSSRVPLKLNAGTFFRVGPATPLQRLEVWTTSGTGTVYILGSKKTRQ